MKGAFWAQCARSKSDALRRVVVRMSSADGNGSFSSNRNSMIEKSALRAEQRPDFLR